MSALLMTRRYHFSAGHRLESRALSPEDNARVYGQCYRQHGHNYHLEVTVAGEVDATTGMATDVGRLDAMVRATVLSRVDHYDLSSSVEALGGVITTGENLARTFWEWLAAALPPGQLRKVAVVETENNTFEYAGSGAPEATR